LLVSGIAVPIDSMPQFIQHLVVATPSGALAEGLHRVLGLGLQPTVGDWISVSLWALLAPLLAVRTFRFD
jgi:ABC-type polysaccharide/polyol phosphate export permease